LFLNPPDIFNWRQIRRATCVKEIVETHGLFEAMDIAVGANAIREVLIFLEDKVIAPINLLLYFALKDFININLSYYLIIRRIYFIEN
jgi:hypothetical protein